MPQETKDARLMARVSQRQKDLFQRAADYQGRTLTEFLLDAALEKAEKVIKNYEVIEMTEEDQRTFFEALRFPAEPTPALEDALKLHQELIGDPHSLAKS